MRNRYNIVLRYFVGYELINIIPTFRGLYNNLIRYDKICTQSNAFSGRLHDFENKNGYGRSIMNSVKRSDYAI
jgi:hypothetical protein